VKGDKMKEIEGIAKQFLNGEISDLEFRNSVAVRIPELRYDESVWLANLISRIK